MVKISKYLLLFLLVFFSVREFGGDEIRFINIVNLIFHEAGHTLFIIFGEFIHFLGGTLGQLMVPALLIVYFLTRYDYFSASIMFWWFGQNFIGIGSYIADARSQTLPLIGGEHDWGYLLGELNLLHKDIFIGEIFHFIGYVIMLLAIVLGAYTMKRSDKDSRVLR